MIRKARIQGAGDFLNANGLEYSYIDIICFHGAGNGWLESPLRALKEIVKSQMY